MTPNHQIDFLRQDDAYRLHVDGMVIMDALAKPRWFAADSEGYALAQRLIEQDQGHRLQVVAVGLGALFPQSYLPDLVADFLREISPSMTKAAMTQLALKRGLQPVWSPSGNGWGTVHKLTVRLGALTIPLMVKMAPIHRAPASTAAM